MNARGLAPGGPLAAGMTREELAMRSARYMVNTSAENRRVLLAICYQINSWSRLCGGRRGPICLGIGGNPCYSSTLR